MGCLLGAASSERGYSTRLFPTSYLNVSKSVESDRRDRCIPALRGGVKKVSKSVEPGELGSFCKNNNVAGREPAPRRADRAGWVRFAKKRLASRGSSGQDSRRMRYLSIHGVRIPETPAR